MSERAQIVDEFVDKHLDAVLRASGSALRHYSFEKTRAEMRSAMLAAMVEAIKATGLLEALKGCVEHMEVTTAVACHSEAADTDCILRHKGRADHAPQGQRGRQQHGRR